MIKKDENYIEETKKMCDEHLISLKRICRLCGTKLPNYQKQSKGCKKPPVCSKLADDIKPLWDVDIKSDLVEKLILLTYARSIIIKLQTVVKSRKLLSVTNSLKKGDISLFCVLLHFKICDLYKYILKRNLKCIFSK